MAAFDGLSRPGHRTLLRVAYASRAGAPMAEADIAALARAAAQNNLRRRISGVLLHGEGSFLQWLEGPAEAVCALMARIVADPRHHAVRLLGVGWVEGRRFARWPMQVIAGAPDEAAAAFDRLASLHRLPPDGAVPDVEAFADRLLQEAGAEPPELPEPFRHSLRARADFVDATCAALACAWGEDRCSGFGVTRALARLGVLWQRAGRSAEPERPRGAAAIAIPPGAGEILGATVKADLLRAAGWSVRLVAEASAPAARAALSATEGPILVAAPRVGHAGDTGRAAAFAERLRRDLPGRCVLLGGRRAGALVDWPARLELRCDAAAGMPAASVAWDALADIARRAS